MINLKESVSSFLVKIGISANFLTLLGLFFSFLSAFYICLGSFFIAGALLLFSGLCDLLDGAVARASGKVSVFGGILDSTLDRYGDGIVLCALALRAVYLHEFILAGLAVAALLGSFTISYIRARAECEMDNCRVGFWERGERLVYLALGLLLNNLIPVLLVVALGTQWTAWQRLSLARRGTGTPQVFSTRKTKAYALKVGAIILIALFFRP